MFRLFSPVVVVFFPFILSCSLLTGEPCENFALLLCEECNVGDNVEDTTCACLADGEVDNASKYFKDKDEAEQWCYRTQQEAKGKYTTDEDVAECRQGLDFFDEFGDDACESYGFSSGGGNDSWGAGDGDWDGGSDPDPEVSISWPDDSTLSVTVANLDNGGVFGMAETGLDSGWYEEDCLTGSYCKPVINGDNTFTSVTSLDEVSFTTTLFNGTLHAQITYAVWDAVTDECVHCSGDDCSYYADDGC